MKNTELKPILDPHQLYLGDNGACFCGGCAGASAKYTGRDISGQRVYALTEEDLAIDTVLCCEICGSTAEEISE